MSRYWDGRSDADESEEPTRRVEIIEPTGVFKPGRDLAADRHLNLLRLRAEEMRKNPHLARFEDGKRIETKLLSELREATRAIGGSPTW